ncbi:hypothetical protein CB0940_05526 [Cercospora beticola]|uniref:DUF7587 domain-containing protein n=1 Tax=Cercospora beticola TaxID=122368 RepID=A0A2G5HYA4_CERBT|nr:hypothetical protein CB0940_05526 [Cercospora beticola]PIA97508.1 hypothetical protein CB0940_05526 [Cercospora beticola]WPA98084.1 hypothetical protein RHO25_002695 [Cercospora beticola]
MAYSAFSAYTQQAVNDSPIPPSCIYNLPSQPAGPGFLSSKPSGTGGRIGFRVDHSACGTGTKYTNGLYPRLYDEETARTPPTLSLAHHHLLWKSRLAGPFVSIWRSWTRALRWARYLQKKGCTEIMVHIIDLDAIPPENTIYDANLIVQELHRRDRARDLDVKNHWEELLILNGVHESVGAVIGSLPAGSDNTKIPSNFANVLVPREVYDIVVDIWEKAASMSEEAHRLQQEQQQEQEESYASPASSAATTAVPMGYTSAMTATHDWAESHCGYYTPSAYSSSPSSTAGSPTTPSLSHSHTLSDSSTSTLFSRRTYSVSSSTLSEEGEIAEDNDDQVDSSHASSASPDNSVAKTPESAHAAAANPNVANGQQQKDVFGRPPPPPAVSTLFDTLLSRLYTDMHLRRGYVDSLKLMELVIAMCTDFTSASSTSSTSCASADHASHPKTTTMAPKLNGAMPPWRQHNEVCIADVEERKRKDSVWTNASSYAYLPAQGRGSVVG